MGLRSKIKGRLRRLIRPGEGSVRIEVESPAQQPAEQRKASPPPAGTPPKASPPPAGTPPKASPPPADPPPKASPPPADTPPKAAIDPDKVARHLERTRKGLLRFLDKNGGEAGLAELHDHSERRYFIGHQKFSQLMEGMVMDGLVDYDWDLQQAKLTDSGRESLEK